MSASIMGVSGVPVHRSSPCGCGQGPRGDAWDALAVEPFESLGLVDRFSDAWDLADRMVIGADTRKAIAGTTKVPFRWIVNVEMKTGGKWRSNGSGTLIGRSTILTAGHVVQDKSVPMRVTPGRRGLSEPLGAREVPMSTAARVRYPGFEYHVNGTKQYRVATRLDLGILHTSTPFPSSVGVWSVSYSKSSTDPLGRSVGGFTPWKGLKVNLSGYPMDLPAKGHGCRTSEGKPCDFDFYSATRTRRCGTTASWTYDEVLSPVSGGIVEYANDTCKGHSGSPVWVKRSGTNGGRVLFAVHIARDDVASAPIANRSVHITSQVLTWIKANLR